MEEKGSAQLFDRSILFSNLEGGCGNGRRRAETIRGNLYVGRLNGGGGGYSGRGTETSCQGLATRGEKDNANTFSSEPSVRTKDRFGNKNVLRRVQSRLNTVFYRL